MLKFLVVDDDDILRFSIKKILESRSYIVDEASNGALALSMVEARNYDGIFLDVNMPQMSGLEALSYIKRKNPSTFCVILTAYSNVSDALEAMKMGAYDYLEKPVTPEKIFSLIDDALKSTSMVQTAGYCALRSELDFGKDYSMVGESESIKKVYELIYKLAMVDSSVLIMGESGTGKELVARALHYSSSRKKKPFVVVNCGAIPENLVESELFGHERGAFTGADRKKIGKFQYANGGTLFLDEIGDMPLLAQVKLLRVLQEGKITPLGSNQEVSVDVRIIAATNKQLVRLVCEGRFRADLFYRLNVFPIELPPLRERVNDIKTLSLHFIDKLTKKEKTAVSFSDVQNPSYHHEIKDIDYLALKALESYNWPGNIRELENVIEHAYVLETGSSISLRTLPKNIQENFKKFLETNNKKEDDKYKILDQSYDKKDVGLNLDLDLDQKLNMNQESKTDLNKNSSNSNRNDSDNDINIESDFNPIGVEELFDDGSELNFVRMKENFEKNFLIKALTKYNGRINQIASSTNITKMTLLRKLEKYGLDPKKFYK